MADGRVAMVECGCGEDTWQLGIGGRTDLVKGGEYDVEEKSGWSKGTAEKVLLKAPEPVLK